MARDDRYMVSTGGNRRRTSKPTPRQLQRARFEVFVRDDFTCRECGARAIDRHDEWGGRYAPYALHASGRRVVLELDHIVPYRDGGQFTVENLRVLCQPCNGSKGAH